MAHSDKSEAGKFQSLPWLVLSGLVGIYAVNTPTATNAIKDATKPAIKLEQPADAAHKADEKNPLLDPIHEFHSTHDGQWKHEDLKREIHGYETEFMIATVPDPIDTPFGYSFDQVVDAIQRGVQQKSGYLLDRSWLPWEVDRKVKPNTDPTQLRETMPGVLLFRHGKDAAKGVKKPGLCVVFLVGETPLGGIHKQAFWKCLTTIRAAGHPATEPIRVVGPYFTGSQTSLQFLLADWFKDNASPGIFEPARPTKFQVIFGNASAIRMKEFFKDAWGPDRLEIGATVVPARVQLNTILNFLARRDGARSNDAVGSQTDIHLPGRLAILTESNTGFGKQFTAYGEHNEIAVLRFPLHISRLKSEYAQAFRKKDEQSGLASTATISPSGFEDAGGVSEGVPAQGGAATTAANNAVLANILSTISHDRYRYVGVMATDTRDKLFLIRLIREYCPDVHIFVTDADVLLTHPDYRFHMKGVIVGSTYPLYARNQEWVNPAATELLLLSSSAAQGYYNATLAIMGCSDQMLEYAPPAFARGEGVPDDRPPVWVSMVAPNGTLVPLQVFTGYDDTKGYVWRKPGGTPPGDATAFGYPASLYLMGLVLIGFWALLIVKCWRGGGVWAVRPVGFGGTVGVFRTVLFGSQVLVAVAIVAVASVRVELTGYRTAADIVVVALAGLAWLAFLGMAIGGLSLRRAAAGPERKKFKWNVLNALMILGLLAFTGVFLERFWHQTDLSHRALFFVRAVDLGTGLSPLTPLVLMCLAIAAGAYFQLERNDLARKCRVPSPFPSSGDRVFDRLQDLDRILKVQMSPGRFWKRHRIILGALLAGLVLGGVTVWRQSLPTVEGNMWDGLFVFGFWAIYAFAAVTILQTLILWRNTKQLLAAAAEIPLVRVFARLPSKVSAVITKHLYTRSTQPLLLQINTHQLRQLAESAKADPEAPDSVRSLSATADEADIRLKTYTTPERGKPGDRAAEVALRDTLSVAASRGLAALAPRWKSLPTDQAFGASSPATDAPEPPWVPKAEELVATQMVNYLSQFFIQLRSLMFAVVVCSCLLLIAATSYPFHPEKLLLMFLLGLVGAGLVLVLYVFVDMSRDETVSRVTRSTPGKFSLDSGFLGAFFTYVVPTLGILAAQLSGSFRWALEPILRVVK